ncbi:wings apart-like protein regulation of heterochromatin-domain-containing protein [Fomitopsis serialis]|uniref:wings apart-like protein regulation of heterochromatin-domain-containing protein n=1 Tax=Fomitopsis serialis TaxID=139415 RepID=UPI002008E66B|nr:wings apart-like protein regulation of heterochromatin-domain-containing protein [Neoantrodia serialis]KAH9924173.1 wings apart-like protein regulation of heterochromatin-domain-containing protein [Neoantrodia serialis]
MLRRTATDSSTSSPGGSFTATDNRDQPYPAPRTPTKLMKTRSDSIIDLTLGSPSSHPLSQKFQSLDDISISSPPHPVRPTAAAANIRTYAGKSRSFLVALPAAQLGVGGLSRSNSDAAGLDDSGLLVGSQEDEFDVQESYTDRRIRWGVDNSEDDPRPWSPPPESASPSKRKGKGKQTETPPVPLPNGMMNDLKSITELRSKGESRRFLDEVGYLFEGLEANSPSSVRRASALEIVTKLCEPDFARKAKAADFLERTWQVLREAGAGKGDKVMDTILAFYAALVSRDTRDLTDLAGRSDFVSALYNMLDGLERSNDPLWLISCSLSDAELRRAGIQRVDKTLLVGLEKLVRKKSGLFESGETISTRLLISTALVALPSSCQNTTHVSSLLRTFQHELAPLPSRLSAYESGLPILSPPSASSSLDTPSFGHADNCLRLLDSYLLGTWTSSESSQGSNTDTRLDPEREEDLAPRIVGLCNVCDVAARDPEHEGHSVTAYRCMESALRVLISLTHDDVQWCQAVLSGQLLLLVVRLIVQSQRHYVSGNQLLKQEQDVETEIDDAIADGEHAATSLDRQCLALGLLTNLAQISHAAKDSLRTTRLSFHCAGKPACTTTCRCGSRVSALSCLALVYSQYTKSETEDGVESIIRGHMAVLFGLLMRDCRENQRVLLDALPGTSNKQKLEKLAEHARDFTSFYVDFTRRVSQVVQNQSQSQSLDLDDDGPMEDFGGFAISEDDRVGKMLSDSHGAAVANDVVTFLGTLIRNSR